MSLQRKFSETLLNKTVNEIEWNGQRKLVQNKLFKQNEIKNPATNVPEKYEINVKTRWTTNI